MRRRGGWGWCWRGDDGGGDGMVVHGDDTCVRQPGPCSAVGRKQRASGHQFTIDPQEICIKKKTHGFTGVLFFMRTSCGPMARGPGLRPTPAPGAAWQHANAHARTRTVQCLCGTRLNLRTYTCVQARGRGLPVPRRLDGAAGGGHAQQPARGLQPAHGPEGARGADIYGACVVVAKAKWRLCEH